MIDFSITGPKKCEHTKKKRKKKRKKERKKKRKKERKKERKRNTHTHSYLFSKAVGDVCETDIVDVVVSNIKQTHGVIILQQIPQLYGVGRLKAIVGEVKFSQCLVHLRGKESGMFE